jgi:hypothetical protein
MRRLVKTFEATILAAKRNLRSLLVRCWLRQLKGVLGEAGCSGSRHNQLAEERGMNKHHGTNGGPDDVRPPDDSVKKTISDFLSWLPEKVEVAHPMRHAVEFARPSPADWLMQVHPRGGRVRVEFNPYILRECSADYYEMVVLHECFHYFVQNLPNKDDAKVLKDDFGDVMMKLLDIEADYFTALYYKERQSRSLVDVFRLYYEGSRVFADPHIRNPKLERFIGFVLSVTALYLEHAGRTSASDLYLPTIGSITTDDNLHILIARRSHFKVHTIQASYSDFQDLKKCYTNVGGYSVSGYVRLLITFACKALGHPIPAKMMRQIEALEAAEKETAKVIPMRRRDAIPSHPARLELKRSSGNPTGKGGRPHPTLVGVSPTPPLRK